MRTRVRTIGTLPTVRLHAGMSTSSDHPTLAAVLGGTGKSGRPVAFREVSETLRAATAAGAWEPGA